MKLADYMALNGPAPAARIAYGPAPSQYAELFVPSRRRPLPGGGAGARRLLDGKVRRHHPTAQHGRRPARARGIAVWNVEYRRVDEPAAATPACTRTCMPRSTPWPAQAGAHPLDLNGWWRSGIRPAASWCSGSRTPQPDSGKQPAVPQQDPLPVKAIVSLGGLADLRRERELIKTSCGRDTPELAGLPGPGRPDVYADTNAAELMPNGSYTVLVTGELDTISPPRVAHDYAARARAAGDSAEVVILPGASHYDEVAASSASWPLVRRRSNGRWPGRMPNWLNPPRQRRVKHHVGGRHRDAGQQVVLALLLDRQARPLDEVAHAAAPAGTGRCGRCRCGRNWEACSRLPRWRRAPSRRRQESCTPAAGA
jgi:hypothetical protein